MPLQSVLRRYLPACSAFQAGGKFRFQIACLVLRIYLRRADFDQCGGNPRFADPLCIYRYMADIVCFKMCVCKSFIHCPCRNFPACRQRICHLPAARARRRRRKEERAKGRGCRSVHSARSALYASRIPSVIPIPLRRSARITILESFFRGRRSIL